MDMVSQQYWNDAYQHFRYYIADDIVTRWMDECGHLLPSKGRMFEFGCYPGRYMAFLGKKGYEVNGMDLAPNMGMNFINWLQGSGIQTGSLQRGDVLQYAAGTEDRFDLVCSFGFIEHFHNFGEVIALHSKILKPGGSLLIMTPNFRGWLQQFLHHTLDKENLHRHYLPSMKPHLWARQLKALGYEVQFAGYFGNFDFWSDVQPRNLLQRTGLRIIHKLTPVLRLLPDSAVQSPYCGIVAKLPPS